MLCPSCGWDVRFLWKEGDRVFASPLETGIQGAVRLPRVACDRCGGIFDGAGRRVPQDEEFSLREAMSKMWGEDRNRPALPEQVGDDG